MKVFNKKRILLIAAVVMVLLVSITATLAYFSDFDRSKGESTLYLTGKTEITEDPTDNSKSIKIKNVSEDDVDMVTRVKVVAPFDLDFPDGRHDGWEYKDGWWYYTKILTKSEPTNITNELFVQWKIPAGSPIENFDVVVLHESAVVQADANGNVAQPAGWDYIPAIPVN